MNEQDCLRRFLFEALGVRGEWVRLHRSLLDAKRFQQFANAGVESQLGQALAAVVLLSATIKFKGSMVMQIQGGGGLRALVAQATHERKIRGFIRSEDVVNGDNLKQMMGEGSRLVLTVESDTGEPYQGIVGVEAEQLADVLRTYFSQSEQLDTRLWLFANAEYAVGLFIQELPSERKDKSDWQHIETLAATVTENELLTLDCETLLHRLFHEEQVRLYDAEPVIFQCNCSRQKIAGTLRALGRSELEAILQERDDIAVDCQFCGEQYRYDRVDVERLLTTESPNFDNDVPSTRH